MVATQALPIFLFARANGSRPKFNLIYLAYAVGNSRTSDSMRLGRARLAASSSVIMRIPVGGEGLGAKGRTFQ